MWQVGKMLLYLFSVITGLTFFLYLVYPSEDGKVKTLLLVTFIHIGSSTACLAVCWLYVLKHDANVKYFGPSILGGLAVSVFAISFSNLLDEENNVVRDI